MGGGLGERVTEIRLLGSVIYNNRVRHAGAWSAGAQDPCPCVVCVFVCAHARACVCVCVCVFVRVCVCARTRTRGVRRVSRSATRRSVDETTAR